MNSKKGETVVTAPFTILIAMAVIITITIYCINMITPFIWYQKLQIVATKYMYIIDKYGYLTIEEKENMVGELKDEGFNEDYLLITYPRTPLPYGTLIELKIDYVIKQKAPYFSNIIATEEKSIPICIKKYSYSKI